jgi:diacylglycerol kinase (ATP)
VRAAIIYNPSAGKARADVIASAVQRGLIRRGLDAELHATRSPKDATAIAQRLTSTVDIVVAVGGDGTVNEVANGLAGAGARPARADMPGAVPAAGDGETPLATGHRATLGIVPAGTVNVLALELGLPFQVERACDVIASGKTIALDLGKVNGRGFFLMTGAGIDALTVRSIDRRAKRRFRELAFLGTGLRRGLTAPSPAFLVRAGG